MILVDFFMFAIKINSYVYKGFKRNYIITYTLKSNSILLKFFNKRSCINYGNIHIIMHKYKKNE